MEAVRRTWARRAALAVTVALVSAAAPLAHAPEANAAIHRPNILFVLADDLDVQSMSAMPRTLTDVGKAGVRFSRYFVSVPSCCPSRVTTLRGQFAHNSGVRTNGSSNGGFDVAYKLGIEKDTIATRLHRSGYRTALIGKYLNGYPGIAGRRYIPPGWTTWASPVAGDPYSQYDYVLNENGVERAYGHEPSDYGNDVYMQLTDDFIRTSVAKKQPFFAFVAPYAPHKPSTPAPEDVGSFAGAQAPRTASFNQADVRAMPDYIRDLPPLTPDEIGAIDTIYQRRLESLQSLDRGIHGLVQTLRSLHQLRRTYIVFTSDNGFHLGQHRLPAGKQTPYDTDTRVPFMMRGPGIEAGTRNGHLVGNVDLAPTFADMARIGDIPFADGRSIMPLVGPTGERPKQWRAAYLLEHWREVSAAASGVPTTTGPKEPADVDEGGLSGTKALDKTVTKGRAHVGGWSAVRTRDYLYVKDVGGARQLYDVRTDPDQMHNLAGRQPTLEQHLAKVLADLRKCNAKTCRKADHAQAL